MTAYLILENGTIFEGEFFGTPAEVTGEIVFNTGMTGYLETISDPSHKGQIVLQTFPLVGNYGVIPSDLESETIYTNAYIVKYPCQEPSNFRSCGNLDTFFMSQNITGLKGIDTRALTKIIRENGVMNGKITLHPPTQKDRDDAQGYSIKNAIGSVSCKDTYICTATDEKYNVALLDFGVRKSTIHAFTSLGCTVHVFPHTTTAEEILKINPQGIILSSGPGNPAAPENDHIIETIKKLSHIPTLGICLGHLLLAIAKGYKTEKMKFGHRGSNQPIKELATGRVYMSTQNHGYVVLSDDVSFKNVNDGTCEGLDYGNSFSVQFIPGGDTKFIYSRFIERMIAHAAR